MLNADIFAQKIETLHWNLAELYRTAGDRNQPQTELLPGFFTQLGIASEALQLAARQLQLQNEKLASIQKQLEAERQRYQQLFESSPDGYLLTDLEATILEANASAAALLKTPEKSLKGLHLQAFILYQERQLFAAQLPPLQAAKKVWRQWRLQQQTGDILEVAIMVAPLNNSAGQPTALLWLLRDVSQPSHPQISPPTNSANLYDNRSTVVYSKNEIIPLNPQGIYIVIQGLVKLTTLSENGEDVLVGFASPKMPFGSGLTALQIYQATAMSNVVQLISLSWAEISESPQLAQAILPQINQRLQQTELLLGMFGQRRVKERLCHLLLLLKQQIGEPVSNGTCLNVRLTHEDLAQACCTTRVTITRILNQLQQEGQITFDYKHHLVLKNDSF
ncbi:helix-turn-helix domain-containing protein [Ancylothrix sp. C2]|uniref:helix-turn-helix domain-containing protein n=1 Tax=Ancylothrix sp. D3o TaxID=2953691 RepID=UPI0021BBA06D|nr:helix-turn-helix domain-containing protein [Ancylothrix sp. D3o]MCT7948567.1 helix-turn-helix domain-containing protein [Ancylothrix sp. D3o]